LRNANGRHFNNISGMYTLANTKGAPVIDYMITKECNFNKLCNFTTDSFNEFSDHAGVLLTLRCSKRMDEIKVKYEVGYKCGYIYKNIFGSQLISRLPYFNSLTSNIEKIVGILLITL
jgi:hypothetical protein